MRSLDIPNASWGGIAAFYSIIHIPRSEVVATLREMFRTLRAGGSLLLAFHIGDETVHLDDWWGRQVSVDFHFFRPEEMVGYLVSAGFDVQEIIGSDPYPNVEHPSRRAYIFAEKPPSNPTKSAHRIGASGLGMRCNDIPLRGTLIGCGFVSRYHLQGWSRVPNPHLVAICDLDTDRLERAPRMPAPNADRYRDPAELFAKEAPLDFVEICTGADSHRGPRGAGGRAWRAHPLPEAGSGATAGLSGHDRGLQSRRRPVDDPRKLAIPALVSCPAPEIEAGTIGESDPAADRPSRSRAALHADGFAAQPYLAETAPRLILMDMGCHLVDTARYLFGEIQAGDSDDRPIRDARSRRRPGHAGSRVRRRSPSVAST